MFSKKNKFLKKVTHKLTLNFIILFTLLLLIIVGALNYGMQRVYKEQSLKKIQLAFMANRWLEWEQDVTTMNVSLEYIGAADGNYNVVYLLISEEGKIIASSNVSKSWFTEIATVYPQLLQLKPGEQFNAQNYQYTLRSEEITDLGGVYDIHIRTYRVINEMGENRICISYKTFDNGRMLIFGQFFQDEVVFFDSLKKISIKAFLIMLVITSLLSYTLSRYAMKGVERVTKTALSIKKGDLHHRVPVGNEGEEIENLANAFNDMLERISTVVRELTEVTNNIAHDLRSPITHIRGIAETTLLKDSDPDAYKKMAATVVEESDRLINLINILLDIAEADSGIETSEKSKVEVQDILKKAHELFLPVAEDKGIDLRIHLADQPVHVSGNKSQLQRVFANLIDNAIKYTHEKGQVNIQIESNDHEVQISVSDSGIGIDQEHIPNIFKRFYRVDKSRTNNGNGLGLSLAQSIVKAHGGEIRVESEIAKGSTFTVILPACFS